jgi:putative FmdB family regulatory protein
VPFYDQKCEKCGHVFEVMRSIRDTTPVVCEKCGGPTKRLISKTSFKVNGYSAKNGYSRGK